MNAYQHRITVFTPTYNRAYIIEKLYRSLQRQSFRDFEWLVVDDGSTDNTENLFNQWLLEGNDFPIRYTKQQNGGKHRAINIGTDLAKGNLFTVVDSDDYLTDNALEVISEMEDTIAPSSEFAGIAGLKADSKGRVSGTTFSGECCDVSYLEREDHQITGEKLFAYYTDIYKHYKFPEIKGEKFITEALVGDRIGYEGYKIRWFNKVVYIYEYLDEGLTKSGLELYWANPRGYALWLTQRASFRKLGLKHHCCLYYNYYVEMKERLPVKFIAQYLNIPKWKMLTVILLFSVKSLIIK